MNTRIHFFTILLFRLATPLVSMPTQAQMQANELRYTVLHGGEQVGNMTVTRDCHLDSCTYRMSTRIDTRFIIPIHSSSDEESILVHGLIVRSSLLRNQNGRKTRKTMLASNNGYTMLVNGEPKDMGRMPAYPPSLSLYHEEPLRNTTLWSDNYEKQLNVKTRYDHSWEVEFPDGTHGLFHYENGIADRIEVSHPLFPVTFLLNKKN